MNELKLNRKGICTEYKHGHYYLTHTEWDDGHVEIEVHRCVPELLRHSCDKNQLDEAKELFKKLKKFIKELKLLISNLGKDYLEIVEKRVKDNRDEIIIAVENISK